MTILDWFFPVIMLSIAINFLVWHFYVNVNAEKYDNRQRKFRKILFWQFVLIAVVFDIEWIRLYHR